MDDRQRQIRERAGLEESRINVEFLEFLKKWGTPMLFAVAVVAGGMSAYRWYNQRTDDRSAQAFGELEAAMSSGSPESLTAVADQYQGVGSVAPMALLEAGDSYLQAVVSGIKPGSTLKPDGTPNNADDVLTPDDRSSYLDRAAASYQRVYDLSNSKPGRTVFAVGALYGLAAVAESKQDWDGAKSRYEEIIQRTKGTAFDDQAKLAAAREASLESLKQAPVLYPKAELPPLPRPATDIPGLPPGTLTPLPGPPPQIQQPQPQPVQPGPAGPPAPGEGTPTQPPAAPPASPK